MNDHPDQTSPARAQGTVVDIHAHHFPVGLPDLAAETGDARWPSLVIGGGLGSTREADGEGGRLMRGDALFRKVQAVCFDGGARVGDLDAAGVDQQVISPVPVTLVDWAAPADAARFLAAQNDGLAQVAAESSGRLLAMGAVPLQDTELAIAEMARLWDDLDMVGIEITAFVDGRELDDPSLDPFWAAAAAEQVPIFIHPAHQRSAIRRKGEPYEFGLGMLTDTAQAASALVYGGVLDRHANLRIALSHGCGTFGWAHPRLRYMAGKDEAKKAHLDELVRSLWVDALVFDPALLPVLAERFGADHVLFGTDHPFLPEGFDGPRQVLEVGIAAGHLDHRCLGHNALAFLTR